MRSLIVFNMDPEYIVKQGKDALQMVLDTVRAHLPQDAYEETDDDAILFTASELWLRVTQDSPIYSTDGSNITVLIKMLPPDNPLMDKLMRLSKESSPDLLQRYKDTYE